MNFSSKIVEEAVEKIAELPGIGRKSALRLVLFLLKDQYDLSAGLSESILKLKEVKFCRTCHNLSDEELCHICSSVKRQKQVICVVESVRDIMAIEETGHFNGLYHVLGGVISPLDGIGPSDLNIDTLLKRVKEDEVEELIMAISPTIDGETTIYYLSKVLPDHLQITTIARGVSFGGELEYADELTLGRSISSRVPYKNEEGNNR
jgi:recombination protein RecR